jgi:N-methylhydantoinase A/acetophenone carboxylase
MPILGQEGGRNAMITVDVDTGGTFTDGFFTDGDRVVSVKVDTTPHDLVEGFGHCLAKGAHALGHDGVASMLRRTGVVRFSTTAGTNALIQRRGPRIGLLVTPGHESDLYGDSPNVLLDRLLSPDLVAGIDPDDAEGIRDATARLLAAGVRALVVSLPGAHDDPEPERRVRAVIRAEYPRFYLGATPVLCSTDVSRRPPDSLRTNAAVLDAFLHPSSVRTLYRADDLLRAQGARRPLLVARGDGGASRVATTVAIDTLDSGPACGVAGALRMAATLDLGGAVTLDIGGTSADVAVVRGEEVDYDDEPDHDGVRVNVRRVALRSVGVGGGSLVGIEGGAVTVGPQSAGAVPGPACYGLGGMHCTVTDANVAGGYIDPEFFLGGERRLDRDLAIEALDDAVSRPLGVDVATAALAVRRRVAELVADAIRALGPSAAGLPIFAFGGAGGLHAPEAAGLLGVRDVYVLPHASVFSAFGSSTLDVRHVDELPLDGRTPADAAEELLAAAMGGMEVEGFDPHAVTVRLEAVTVSGESLPWVRGEPLPAATRRLRAIGIASVPHAELPVRDATPSAARAFALRDTAGGRVDVHRRSDLIPGAELAGPALVEAADTTVHVPAGWRLAVDARSAAHLRRQT